MSRSGHTGTGLTHEGRCVGALVRRRLPRRHGFRAPRHPDLLAAGSTWRFLDDRRTVFTDR
jgi:hypothetical protein